MNPCCENILNVLVTFLVSASRDVGMSQFVNQGNLRLPGQDCTRIHFFHGNPAVFLPVTGNDLQAFEEPFRFDPSVGFYEAHDHIDSFLLEVVDDGCHPLIHEGVHHVIVVLLGNAPAVHVDRSSS